MATPPHFVALNEVVTVTLCSKDCLLLQCPVFECVPSLTLHLLDAALSLLHPLEGPIHLPSSPGEPYTQLY